MKQSTIKVIDSHTGGEPTRLIVAGGPALGNGSLADRRDRFRQEADQLRRGVVLEPRGSDVIVGGLLCEPTDPECAAGIIFFNNTGFLNMCGHGTIGLMVTLHHLQRIRFGVHRIETPVGTVTATLHDQHQVSVRNVASWRHRKDVSVDVPDVGIVTGDIAWGGNWFFLVSDHVQSIEATRTRQLTEVAAKIRAALIANNITGANGAEIDHVELFGPSEQADSRNFVLCPGGAFDRSPCGTGTSAKLACLFADSKLAGGRTWRQESIVGSVFEGSVEPADDKLLSSLEREASGDADGPVIIPTITGSAWVTAEAELLFDPADPFCHGITT
ncbi:MAG: 4-hydroxyproline epimerase [Fuerstiella sp.]